MLNKILVAVDGSKNSKSVFDQSLDLAKASGARLMLLHVLSNEEQGNPSNSLSDLGYYPALTTEVIEMYQQQWLECESRGLEMLRSLMNQAVEAGVKVEMVQRSGNPGRVICEVAQSWGADAIIMGRRGYAGLKEFILGSISNYVLRHASCPILTVQEMLPSHSKTAPHTHNAMASNSITGHGEASCSHSCG